MNLTKQYLLTEAMRFHREYKCSPKIKDWRAKNSYPSFNEVRQSFGSWTAFLTEAGLDLNIPIKEKYIICKICGRKFETTRINRNICDNRKCRYIRDSIYRVKYLKEKHTCSVFHFIPEDKLIDYFSCVYSTKKDNLLMVKVI